MGPGKCVQILSGTICSPVGTIQLNSERRQAQPCLREGTLLVHFVSCIEAVF